MTSPSKRERRKSQPPRERKKVSPELDLLLRVLHSLVRASGFTQHQVDARLGRPGGYVNQVLNRRLDLKVQDLLTILDVIEIDPVAFFAALRRGRPAEGRRREDDPVPRHRPEAAAEHLERLIRNSLRRALREELGGGRG